MSDSSPTQKQICDLCGCSKVEWIGSEKTANVPTTRGLMDFMVHLACCKRCGLVFQKPLQDFERLKIYYASMFREEGCRPKESSENEIRHRAEFATRYVSPSGGKKVLEIGCADGRTLSAFRKSGFEIFGIEPSEVNADICRQNGIRVLQKAYEDVGSLDDCFDLVTNYYVLEHVLSPVDFLTFCNRLLLPNGVLCFEIPAIENYGKEVSPSNLLYFFEHQHHFTRDTITLLLQRCGFELLDFSEKATHFFGIGLAARKVSEPIPASELSVQGGVNDIVMGLVHAYEKSSKIITSKYRNILKKVFDRSSRQKNIVIFGTGALAQLMMRFPEVKIENIRCFVDNNMAKWNTQMMGISILSPTVINKNDDIVIIASDFYEEIYEQLQAMSIPDERIVQL